MELKIRLYPVLILFIVLTNSVIAQYTLNGDATAMGTSCYQLTPGNMNKSGNFFSTQQINLNEPFDLYASLNFGFIDVAGGDGIAFSFQQFNANINPSAAGGLGIVGISPSLIVEFDTDSNSAYNDLASDHIALMKNGILNHSSAGNIVGPFDLLPGGTNVEDGNDHNVHIKWDPNTDLLNVWVDCNLRITYSGNIVNDFFFGDPMVFWGFSASTSTQSNIQQVCIEYLNIYDTIPSTTLCEGTAYAVDAGFGSTYSWSPVAGLSASNVQTPTATPSATTTYLVTVTDSCGVTRQDSFTYHVNDSIRATISGDTYSCVGTTVPLNIDIISGSEYYITQIFDGTNLYNYVLDSNGNDTLTGLPPEFTVTANTTTYTIFSITNDIGCGGIGYGSALLSPDITTGMQVNTTSTTCNGYCDGSAEIIIPHDNGSYTYTWPSGNNGATQTGLCAGAYVVTITNGGGCQTTTNVSISEPLPISLTPLSNQSICEGDTATLTTNVSGGTPPYNYSWSNSGSTASIDVSPTSNTTYGVTVSDANNCPVVVSNATVSVYAPFNANSDPNTGLCIGSSLTISAYASGGDGNYSYNWSNGSNNASQFLTPDSTTTYFVTISDGCSDPIVDSLTIQVDTFPTHTYTVNTPICEGSPTIFELDSYDPNAYYLYNFGDGSLGFSEGISVAHTYDDTGVYNITLRVKTDYCDSIRTDTGFVTVAPSPVANFTATPEEFYTITSPYGTFTSTTDSIVEWMWFIDGIRVDDGPSFTFDFLDSGTYEIGLLVINNYGCEDIIYKEFKVGYEFPGFYIPNAFSPNGDGVNDTFGPVINERHIEDYEFFIYNRLGDLVFSTNDPLEYWNGQRENSGANSGQDYFWWKIVFTDISGEVQEHSGKLILIK